MTDERALKLARLVYADYMEQVAAAKGDTLAEGQREKCLRGDYDHQHGVQIALAAIKLTTQLAAEYAHAHAHFGVKAGLLRFKHLPADGGENV